MTTSNKIIIPSSALPPVNEKLDSYYLRYRITSEDRNSTSAWSPIMQVPTFAVEDEEYFATGSGKLQYISNSRQLAASWPLTENILEYDVWFKWQSTAEQTSTAEPSKQLSSASKNGNYYTYTTVDPHGYALGDIVTIINTNVWYNLEDLLITSIPTANTFVLSYSGVVGSIATYVGSGYVRKQTYTYRGRIKGNKVDFYQTLDNFANEDLFSIRVYVPHSPLTHNTDYLVFGTLNFPTDYYA